jgi:hypothetical protein
VYRYENCAVSINVCRDGSYVGDIIKRRNTREHAEERGIEIIETYRWNIILQ